MAVSNIRQLFKGMFDSHETLAPVVTEANWDQCFKKSVSFVKPIADAAAGTTYEWPFFFNSGASTLTVTAVKIVPFAALTADNTNYKTVSLNRRLAAGSATVIASRATTITDTGNWVALTPITLTLSTTAADLVVAAGETLSLHLVHTASGVAVPVMSITVDYLETS